MIKAVVFDLDDTLVPEYEYVKSGFKAVASYFEKPDLYDKLIELFGKDKHDVFGRAGLTNADCDKAVGIYRSHKPDIKLEKEIADILSALKESGYKLGIITDGRPEGQRNKIEALGLNGIVDCIVVTDELGGTQYRKPCPTAFELVSQELKVMFDEMVYVGDNPAKDFYISSIFPIKTIRLYGTSKSIYSEEHYYCGVKESYSAYSPEEIIGLIEQI